MNRITTLDDCRIINLQKISDVRGNLTPIEANEDIPFGIKRVYYLYDVPGGECRGGHAHKALYQLILAVSGSFTVTLDDGKKRNSFMLNRPYQGLLVVPGIWRTLENFSSGSVCLVMASEKYDENDYIRRYDEYLFFKNVSI